MSIIIADGAEEKAPEQEGLQPPDYPSLIPRKSPRPSPAPGLLYEQVQSRAKEKGICRKMRDELSAKLLVIVWTLMKKKECFDPKYLALKDQKTQKQAA